MTAFLAWLAERTAGAPPALVTRAGDYLAQVGSGGGAAARLAAAATLALREVHGRDRSRATALDLLTADSLITLALLAQAEQAPADLERFSRDIVRTAAA